MGARRVAAMAAVPAGGRPPQRRRARRRRLLLLHLYRKMLALRRSTEVLRRGDLEVIESPEQLLVVRRELAGDERWVMVNFSEEEVDWQPLAARAAGGAAAAGEEASPRTPFVLEISSGGAGALSAAGSPYRGRLGPEEAVVLRLA